MSYILESLKKSDQERRQDVTPENASRPPYVVDDDFYHHAVEKKNNNRVILLGVFFIGLLFFVAMAAFYASSFYSLSSSDDSMRKTQVFDNDNRNINERQVRADTDIEHDNKITGINNTPPFVVPSHNDAALLKPMVEEWVDDDVVVVVDESAVANSSPQRRASNSAVSALYEQSLSSPSVQSLYEANQQLGPDFLKNNSAGPVPKAVSESDQQVADGVEKTNNSDKERLDITRIFDLDRIFQKSIPEINYGAHIYASDNKSGFVILNGAKRRSGERMKNGIYIEKIAENELILSYEGVVFSLPAMRNWTPY